jgi:hypothetical protein
MGIDMQDKVVQRRISAAQLNKQKGNKEQWLD